MSPQEQRIAIAEVVGHKNIRLGHFCNDCGAGEDYMSDSSTEWPIPDYLNDLNAMHEAWMTCIRKKITPGGFPYQIYWRKHLANVCRREADEDGYFSLSNATATQRAEAFLRTVGKWRES